MTPTEDLHHQLNSLIASLKAGLFVLDKEVAELATSVKARSRVKDLDRKLTELHELLKTVLHDVPKTSD